MFFAMRWASLASSEERYVVGMIAGTFCLIIGYAASSLLMFCIGLIIVFGYSFNFYNEGKPKKRKKKRKRRKKK